MTDTVVPITDPAARRLADYVREAVEHAPTLHRTQADKLAVLWQAVDTAQPSTADGIAA